MAAYIITDLSVHNKEQIAAYQKLAPIAIAAFDGKFIVRGGQVTPLEGDWNPERIVVIEFPTVERANEYWNSEMYSAAKIIRQNSATTRMIIVQGV